MRSAASPAAEADDFVPRSLVYASLAKLLLPALLGLFAVDRWVGWLDRENVQRTDLTVNMRDEVLGHTNRPGYRNELTHINSQGLRSEEIPADASPVELRILGVGASQTYGAGGTPQWETWSYHLEEQLHARGARDVRVLNGGVMGYTTLQAARRALVLLPELDPDLILVFTRPGRQSLLDSSPAGRVVLVGGDPVPRDVVASWPPPLRFLPAAVHGFFAEHSNIYLRHRARIRAGDTAEASNAKFVLSRAPRGAEVQGMLDRTLAEVGELTRVAAERGVELRFVVYPESYMDGEHAWQMYLRKHGAQGAPPLDTPRGEPVAVQRELFEARGGICWDLSAEISAMGRERDLYRHATNPHWTSAGHAYVARGLFERIRGEGLLQSLRTGRRARARTVEAR